MFKSFVIAFTLPLAFLEGAQTLSFLVEEALHHNCGIRSLCQGVDASHHDICEQQGAFQPRVSFQTGTAREKLNRRRDSYQYGHLALNWNLYNGGADRAELCRREAEHRIAHLEVEHARKALAREVSRLFYELLYEHEALSLFHLEMETNSSYGQSAEKKWHSGLTSEVDVLEFDVREAEIWGRIKLLEGNYYRNQQELWTLIACPDLEPQLDLDGDFADPKQFDLDHLYQWALHQREEKQIACHESTILRQAVKQARSNFLPSVDLLANYGTVPAPRDERSQGWSCYLNLSIPLWDGATSYHQTRAAAARAKAQEYADCQLDQSIYREVAATTARLESLKECIGLEEKKLGKLDNYWAKTTSEYQHGVKNSPDLATAAELRLTTQLKLLELRRDYSLTLIELSEAVGCYPSLAASEGDLESAGSHPSVHAAPQAENHPTPTPS